MQHLMSEMMNKFRIKSFFDPRNKGVIIETYPSRLEEGFVETETLQSYKGRMEGLKV